MKTDVTVIVQARVGSTRLPGKVLMPLGDSLVIDQVLDQVSYSQLASHVIVATSTSPADDRLVEHLRARNTPYFRGSENDVLDRYYQCARMLGATTIVRVTADCPLIDPSVLDQVIRSFEESSVMYASNVMPETFPDGLDVEVFSFEALEWSWNEAVLPSEREHVTQFIRKHPEWFSHSTVESPIRMDHLRWTLDEPADYRFLCDLMAKLPRKRGPISMEMVLATLQEFPDLVDINVHIKRNEGLMKSLLSDPR